MKRNSTQIEIITTGAVTWVKWIPEHGSNRLNGYPDFSGFSGSSLSVRLKAWQDFLDSGQPLEIIPDPEPIPEPPKPNWDTFNTQMMSNTRFNQVYNQCLSVAPIVANALPVALDQVTTKGYYLFTLIWTQLCQIGGATAEDKQVWGEYAEANNLPQEFITILVG